MLGLSLFLLELFREVHQVQMMGRPGEGGIEPSVEILAQHLLGDVADVEENLILLFLNIFNL